jgi:NNP family nitrate/nitrite transporter-like MFS transporter
MNKARRIRLLDFRSTPMRSFHLSWIAFFLCFFGWFGIAPLMAIVRDELHLTKTQIGNTIMASVAITVIGRIFIGWLCDRIGPRKAYTGLLLFGSFPVIFIGLAHNYETFLLFRLAIGIIGASFVITQYHTTVMFASEIVGTANATAAGWGNLGGGATQIVMPLLFGLFFSAGISSFWSWRLSMAVIGLAMIVAGILYYNLTRDTPDGNFDELRDQSPSLSKSGVNRAFIAALGDVRVWSLGVLYGACFGVELTIDNIAALYFHDAFHLTLQTAGIVAGSFGMMNLFARALGGITSDRLAARFGIRGRTTLLGVTIFLEGLAVVAFSRITVLPAAIALLLLAGLFVKMSNGATYAIVPFVRKEGLGSVSGIVGAGGNLAAMCYAFLFRSPHLSWSTALLVLGVIVAVAAVFVLPLGSLACDEMSSSPIREEVDSLLLSK